MKNAKSWDKTTASECRYGDVAGRIWGDWDILWEDSEADYQGHASFIAKKGRKWSVYEWWYGSCSGCDGWEADGLDDDAVEKAMRKDALWFDSRDELVEWLEKLDQDHRSNVGMERGGGLAFGLDWLTGGGRGRINSMREAVGMPPLQEFAQEKECHGGR